MPNNLENKDSKSLNPNPERKFGASSNTRTKYSALGGFAFRYRNANGKWMFKFRWWRILSFMLVTFTLFWLLVSTFLFVFYKYNRDYSEMTFLKAIKIPFNISEHRMAMGEYNIKKAVEYFRAGDFSSGYKNLIQGIGRNPKNIEAKIMLANLHIRMGKTDDAVQLLKRSLPLAYENLIYMRLYTRLLLGRMEDEELIKVCRGILALEPKNPEVKYYLAMALSTAYAMHGHYDESKEFIVKYGLDKSTPGILRLSKNEWEQGNKEEAIKIVAENVKYIKDLDSVYALLSNYYILMGDYEKVRQYASLRIMEKPFDIPPQIDYLRALANSGEEEKSKVELRKLFENNRNNEAAVLAIAQYATETAQLDLMQKIYDNSIKNNFSTSQFCMMLLETYISCKKYQEAVVFAEDISNEAPKWLQKNDDTFMCLRAVSYYAIGNVNMANVMIEEVIKRKTINPRNMVATARRFALLGESTIAHKLYLAAVEKDPKHQYALVRLIQFEIDSGNSSDLNKYIMRLINLRRPPRDMILRAREALLSDRFIFTTEREKVINAIDMIFDAEKASNNRFLSDLPSDYEEEKVFSSF